MLPLTFSPGFSVARCEAAGVGWGAIHAVVIVGTALAKHTGTGAEFSPSCPRLPSVIVSGESDVDISYMHDRSFMACAMARPLDEIKHA